MKRVLPMLLAICLLLSGCSGWLDGSYQNITPHEGQGSHTDTENVSVTNYEQLYKTLCAMVDDGVESGVINVSHYDQKHVADDMAHAAQQVMKSDPIGAYAVEDIRFELGANAGQPAVAVTIAYLHSRNEIRKIQRLANVTQAKETLADVLNSCNSGIVLYIQNYEDVDFEQWVEDYAAENPDLVMEAPAVNVGMYPENGESRVVELRFAYQNSRESLRLMQSQISPLFDAAAIYAGSEGDAAERYFKLYSFLMGLSQTHQLDTSLTPAYSLMKHGVGDSKAFATVYAAMCKKAGLECIVVTGMKAGEVRYWNIIHTEQQYYHVDLLNCEATGEFALCDDAQMKAGGEMAGYVWDYQGYPACTAPETEENRNASQE